MRVAGPPSCTAAHVTSLTLSFRSSLPVPSHLTLAHMRRKKNPSSVPYKLAFRKYDPIVQQHVLFQEGKLVKGRGGRRAGK